MLIYITAMLEYSNNFNACSDPRGFISSFWGNLESLFSVTKKAYMLHHPEKDIEKVWYCHEFGKLPS